ncbi:hypothetical protein [Xylanimonas ulmi]|uniref:Uncharacterized protein n=1 Tax=Xylanimonas ulmi TaxID=228973 RepID=A0A4Q7M0H5_9MICO|nr:hypothetical protein [Xylanibacterium ulmi]RZS60373.1 hypothetical protein EV386_0628 [Xylanibacterium ulmi]
MRASHPSPASAPPAGRARHGAVAAFIAVAGAAALTGCGADAALGGATTSAGVSGATGPAAPADGQATASDAATSRFLACLAAGGVTARNGIPGDPTSDGLVFVQVDPVPLVEGMEGGVITSSAAAGVDPAELPEELRHLVLTTSDESGTWHAAVGAEHFEATGRLSIADVYAACLADHPDFAQAEWETMDEAQWQAFIARTMAAGLDLARAARAEGLAWVADPTPDDAGAITLPQHVTEADLRALLTLAVEGGHDGVWLRMAHDRDTGFDVAAVFGQVVGDDPGITLSFG